MIGRLIGHYEITAQLGKGGMGEVFRARDTKLDREVALKVLPTEMSGDPERKARFEREARSLASLQHPNVASIYGFEDLDGVRFLVMELVEGEDLSQRLARGAVAPAEARSIAMQIAAGLEAAHDKGLVHRDLKPANIMVSPVGDVKVLDFGLARAWYGDPETEGDPSMSPTITAAMTQAGTILGTAAYMSPEQARGRGVDRRADIWAFGVILYEMLTGQRLFEGDTISDTMAAVLRAEVDFGALPTDDAPELCHLTERCLQRDPRQRLRDIGEARIMLEPGGAALSSMSMRPVHDAPGRAGVRPWLAGVIALACLSIGATLGVNFFAPPAEHAPVHAMIQPPEGTSFFLEASSPGPAVISPDGRMVAFTAIDANRAVHLWLRHLDRADAVMLTGTETAAYPFWSADSAQIGFFDMDRGRLRKIAVRGGPPTTICEARNGKGGTWNEDGLIVFAPSAVSPLSVVRESGADLTELTNLELPADSHRHPRFLPDGNHFVYIARQSSRETEHPVMLGSLDGMEPREVLRSRANAEYSAGHLLTIRENVLLATPWRAPWEAPLSGAFPIVEGVAVLSTGAIMASYSANRDGLLLFNTGETSAERQLALLDLETGERTEIGDPDQLEHAKISPDGTRAVVELIEGEAAAPDLWIVDVASGLRTRLTFSPGSEAFALWTPDGSSVVYAREDSTSTSMLLQSLDDTSSPRLLLEGTELLRPSGFSSDGQTLYFDKGPTLDQGDCWTLSMEPGAEAVPFLVDEGFQGGAVPSPDGRWVAFHADSEQGFDLFVTAATGEPRKWQVSRAGVVWPTWNHDGSILYGVGLDGRLYAHNVDGTGNVIRPGSANQIAEVQSPTYNGATYSVSPDQRSVLETKDPLDQASTISLLHLITDWPATVRQ